jgi:hypothetical protein
MRGLRRAGLLLASALAWMAVTVVALGASLWMHASLEDGRRLAAKALGEAGSDAIPGRLTIERIGHLSLDHVALEGVTVREPSADRRVLHVQHVTFEPVLSALWDRELRLDEVRVRGATLRLENGPDGRMSIAGAFAPPPDPQDDARPAVDVRVGPIHLQDVRALFNLGDQRFEIRDIEGFMRIDIGEDDRIRFDALAGVFLPPRGPIDEVPFKDMQGRVHVQAELMARFEGTIELVGTEMDARVAYFDRDEPAPVEVGLAADGLSAGSTAALAFAAITRFISKVKGRVTLRGDLDRLDVASKEGE